MQPGTFLFEKKAVPGLAHTPGIPALERPELAGS